MRDENFSGFTSAHKIEAEQADTRGVCVCAYTFCAK